MPSTAAMVLSWRAMGESAKSTSRPLRLPIASIEYGGLIGDVKTISVAKHEALREITVELRDKEHADQLAAGLGDLPGVSVAWFHDRAFLAHDGGKLSRVHQITIGFNSVTAILAKKVQGVPVFWNLLGSAKKCAAPSRQSM